MSSAKTQLARIKATQLASAARRRMKGDRVMHLIVRQGAGVVTGVVLGAMKDVPVSLGADASTGDRGIPWKPLVGSVALVGAALTKGSVSAALEGVSIAANAIYAERAVATGSTVAGI